MAIISIELAMHHLQAEPDDQVLVQAQLNAAEEAAMQFLNRRFYADQQELELARAGLDGLMRAARDANAAAVAAAENEEDHGIRCRKLDHARKALADAYEQVDSVGYGIVINDAITSACLLKLGHLFANREEVITDGNAVELPLASRSLLMPYRCRMGV
ncbi:hypothetical protein PSCICL_47320 [Pseudomonas cichorii]|nr:hypothetical protein PSCICL_47320 [Pseudomonas cichorii]